MTITIRLNRIQKRLEKTGKAGGIHSPVIYDPDDPDVYFVNDVKMTKAEYEELRKKDTRDGVVIFLPICLKRDQVRQSSI